MGICHNTEFRLIRYATPYVRAEGIHLTIIRGFPLLSLQILDSESLYLQNSLSSKHIMGKTGNKYKQTHNYTYSSVV